MARRINPLRNVVIWFCGGLIATYVVTLIMDGIVK